MNYPQLLEEVRNTAQKLEAAKTLSAGEQAPKSEVTKAEREAFGRALKTFREATHMTIDEFASCSCVHPRTIQRFETGSAEAPNVTSELVAIWLDLAEFHRTTNEGKLWPPAWSDLPDGERFSVLSSTDLLSVLRHAKEVWVVKGNARVRAAFDNNVKSFYAEQFRVRSDFRMRFVVPSKSLDPEAVALKSCRIFEDFIRNQIPESKFDDQIRIITVDDPAAAGILGVSFAYGSLLVVEYRTWIRGRLGKSYDIFVETPTACYREGRALDGYVPCWTCLHPEVAMALWEKVWAEILETQSIVSANCGVRSIRTT